MRRILCSLALALPNLALAEQHIVDDQDGAPGFVTTGDDWATWGMSGYGYDGSDSSYHYLSHTVGGNDRRGTATWQAELRAAGTWRVEIWFRRTENRSSDADHVITDGLGMETWLVIDQTGDGASGWVDLGEYWCDAGFGGCSVTLDGTDDDGSDEANAVRFTLVAADDDPPDSDPCDGEAVPGAHSMSFYAGSVSGSGWESASYASGAADGLEAHSPNVDSGEILRASGFDVCDPAGEERIDGVVLAVKARTQYDSGSYALELQLDAGGPASVVFTGTSSQWHELDIAGDRTWDWNSLAALNAQVSLHDHPGGARDSDAWVDAFELRVQYTTADDAAGEDTGELWSDTGEEGEPADSGDPGDSAGQSDTGGPPDRDDPGDPYGPDAQGEQGACGGCVAKAGRGGRPQWQGWFPVVAALLPLLGLRRRRP
jgi:hypothetical protein